MRLTFRAKLLLIVGATALAFVLLIVVSALIGVREERRLADLEGRLLPKLELGPQIEGDFDHLRRSLQDAVAAQDIEALGDTRVLLGQLTRRITGAREVI